MNCINSIMSPIIQSTQEYVLIFPYVEFSPLQFVWEKEPVLSSTLIKK